MGIETDGEHWEIVEETLPRVKQIPNYVVDSIRDTLKPLGQSAPKRGLYIVAAVAVIVGVVLVIRKKRG